jgi:predicted Zn-dependent protease
MLLEMGKPDESLAEAEHALRDAPNRYNGLWLAAQAAERAGKTEVARGYRAKIAALRDLTGAPVSVPALRVPLAQY